MGSQSDAQFNSMEFHLELDVHEALLWTIGQSFVRPSVRSFGPREWKWNQVEVSRGDLFISLPT